MPNDPTNPNNRANLQTMPDGSTLDPTRVEFPDGTQAAWVERHTAPAKPEKAFASYDELMNEVLRQRVILRGMGAPDYASTNRKADYTDNAINYGRLCKLVVNQGDTGASDRTSALWTPIDMADYDGTLIIQPPFVSPAVPNNAPNDAIITAFIQWMVGSVTFERITFIKAAGIAWQMPLCARKIMVDLQIKQSGLVLNDVVQVPIAFGRGYTNYSSVERRTPRWNVVTAGAARTIDTGFGLGQEGTPRILMAATGHLATTSPVLLYPMFVDGVLGQNTAALANAVPLAIMSPVQNAGDYFSFDDEFTSELYIGQELYFCLSTRPDFFFDGGVNQRFTLNLKMGS